MQQQEQLFISHDHQAVSLSGDDLHFLVPQNPLLFPDHFNNNNNMTNTSTTNTILNNSFHYSLFQTTPYNQSHHNQTLDQLLPALTNNNNTQTNYNSTSDEAEEAGGPEASQMVVIQERKQRRMISNRESARRSRMRKQRHLDELWSQVVWLRNENHSLADRLSRASESHDRVALENSRLKDEASELRHLLSANLRR